MKDLFTEWFTGKSLVILGFSSVWTLVRLFETYIFDDYRFIIFLGLLVVLDTVLGFAESWKDKNVSAQGFGKTVNKTIRYGIMIIVLSILSKYAMGSIFEDPMLWMMQTGFTYLISLEGLSIVQHTEAMFPGTFPSWLVKKLEMMRDGEFLNSKK